MSLDVSSMTDEEISSRCYNSDVIVAGCPDSRWFARLSDTVIVKCGWSVTAEEASNQALASKYSVPKELNVPKIYRYFRLGRVGFIVMEFFHGLSLEKVIFAEHDGLITRLAQAVCNLFNRIPCESVGPTNGGIPRGYLFSEDGALEPINSISSLNSWLNKRFRLKRDETGFHFDLSDCVFCHLDLARRNFLLLADGSFALLDWEYAGIYPRVFEIYCIYYIGIKDFDFCNDLAKAYKKLSLSSDDENDIERHIDMLDRVYKNNLRYS